MKTENYNEHNAAIFCDAIRKLAENPAALENLQFYLSIHFSVWLEKYATTPAALAREMKTFSEMDTDA